MRRALVVGLAIPALQAAYAAALQTTLRRAAGRLMAGDVEAYLRFYADDAELHFPGGSSWGRVYRGKAEIRGFLERFLSAGLSGEVHEILVSGPTVAPAARANPSSSGGLPVKRDSASSDICTRPVIVAPGLMTLRRMPEEPHAAASPADASISAALAAPPGR